MSTVPTPPLPHDQARVYPIPRADDDARFTFGLTLDVADTLARHGYPIAAGGDFVALQEALFTFLYRRDVDPLDLDVRHATGAGGLPPAGVAGYDMNSRTLGDGR